MARIGILGGISDPIHNSHLRLGKRAHEEFELGSIWFISLGVPPHKKDHKITGGKMRRDAVKLATVDTLCFLHSDFELRRKGDTYTAQTLSLLYRERPEDELYFIMGADSLYEIEHWYHPEAVMGQAVLLVAGRAYRYPYRNMEEQIVRLSLRYGARIYPIHCPETDISSEGIRKAVVKGQPIRDAVPEPVEEYIRAHGLYRRNAAGGYDDGKKICQEDEHMENQCSQIMILREELGLELAPMCYEHSLSISFTCMNLAMRYGYGLDKAELAGPMHNCGKCYSDDITLKKCIKHGIEVTETGLNALSVLHIKYGAQLAEHKYQIVDREILDVIGCHITGKLGMTVLDKILYIANYIEPRRFKAENLPLIRRLAYEDLDETMHTILSGTLEYLDKKGGSTNPMTVEAYEYFKEMKGGSNELKGNG